MDESLRAQIDISLRQLESLILRGRQIRDNLAADPSNASALGANRLWQQDVGVTINQLSGGSKAHWLARAFSEAFLMRSPSGEAIESVPPADIASRLITVLERAVGSLAEMSAEQTASAPHEAAPPGRFDFVHNTDLRPILDQAYRDARRALEQHDYNLALVTFSGVLEAIVTDALEYKGVSSLADAGIPEGEISDWPFETRLHMAETSGLIHAGWARLPENARKYRELTDNEGNLKIAISERDAQRAQQVLHVVMRDLDPGR